MEKIRLSQAASKVASDARIEILRMTHASGASHVASALSVVDILAVLYSGFLKISPKSTKDPNRDVVIVSKGHAAAALYAVLGICGFFPKDQLENYCKNGATIGGHVTSQSVNGVELSTGSLGHGLPYGLGIEIGRAHV